MKDGDEADEDADGAPPPIRGAEAEDDFLLAIDGTGCLLEAAGVLQLKKDLAFKRHSDASQ
jgi:hypothetical protein